MQRIFRTFVALGVLLSVVLVVTGAPAAATTTHESNSKYEHIFYIMMENHATDQIFGNTADAPYINELASKYAISTNYFGVTHPSLPNYLAAISGDFQHIWDDCKAGPTITCPPEEFGPNSGYTNGQELLTPAEIARATNTPHWFKDATIDDQLEAHGLSWKAYMQSLPYIGFTGEYYPYQVVNGQKVPVKLYAQKHDPFMYFPAIRNNPSRLHKVVPFNRFASEAWTEKSAIVIAWDEDDYTGFAGCCHSPRGVNNVVLGGSNAPLLVITSKNAKHFVDSSHPYNHYSLLATIQGLWGLGCLENSCDFSKSQLMYRFF